MEMITRRGDALILVPKLNEVKPMDTLVSETYTLKIIYEIEHQ